MRHATANRPASTMAPPMPTTTPITVFRVLEDMPVDLEESEPFRDAAFVAVELEDTEDVVL